MSVFIAYKFFFFLSSKYILKVRNLPVKHCTMLKKKMCIFIAGLRNPGAVAELEQDSRCTCTHWFEWKCFGCTFLCIIGVRLRAAGAAWAGERTDEAHIDYWLGRTSWNTNGAGAKLYSSWWTDRMQVWGPFRSRWVAGQCSHASTPPHFNAVSVWLRGSFREKSGMTGRLRSLENWCSQEGISKTANQREGEALSSRGSSCWGEISVLRRFFLQDTEQIW